MFTGHPGQMPATLPERGGASLVRALSEAVDPHAVLCRIVEQALSLLPRADGAGVQLVDDDGLVYVSGSGSMAGLVGTKVQPGASLAGASVRSRQILLSDDTESDDRVDGKACRSVAARSIICVPLVQDAGPVGVLTAASSQPVAFDSRDVQLLARLAEFMATAVATASEFSRTIKRLMQDPGARPEPADPYQHDIAWFIANVMRPEMAPVVDLRQKIESVLEAGSYEILYQPIVDLRTGALFGAEALARFTELPYRPPNVWFAEAEKVGLGVELELAAVRAALAPLPFLPEHLRLSVNVGAAAIGTDDLAEMVEAAGPDRVILELTEHLQVEDYPKLNARLARLREAKTFLAIDDTGAGISSLTHVLKLAPDVIKLDREITSGIDFDPVRRALTSALITFAGETGARVVAEGIETPGELETLQDLGVVYGQGFYLGRPGPSADLRDR